ncbi:hypothetical protein ASE74_21065 [Pedobacter sp. Leaf216]|uniref:hypothetical protein n=1 Tax=Pedobacter sp. Leaf216 TaxID=1735684 RepID=UPI0006FE4F86|nr:hypothetical protein [Pedobacter sp. Leaf216]KQM73005.1 hypothetical protein ASE74_21065 [Pedobacter sp. Leaf216]
MNNEFVQAENSVFFKQLDICCKKVAKEISEKSISEWRNSDYIKLSGLLHRKTKVHLSENTLKRIFGKLKTSTRYYPQKATRDALAQFIGFRDWYEFELLHPLNEKDTPIKPEIKPGTSKHKNKTYIYVLLGFGIIMTGIIFFLFLSGNQSVSNVKLTCLNPEGKSPHSAIFKLDVLGNLPDDPSTFIIDFGDAKTKRSASANAVVNHYYETPGRYFPILYHKNTPIDTAYVYLQSKGWDVIATIQYDTTRVYPILKKISTAPDYHVTTKELLNAGIDTSKTFFVSFANVRPTAISADNFEFSADIKTSAERPGVRCSQADIVVYGESDSHFLSIIKPECIAWSAYRFSEQFKNGDKTDLRAFGHDLTISKNVKLRVKNQHVSLLIDNKEVFKTTYHKPIGKLMGFKIMFAGIGSFKNFNLADLKTGEKF